MYIFTVYFLLYFSLSLNPYIDFEDLWMDVGFLVSNEPTTNLGTNSMDCSGEYFPVSYLQVFNSSACDNE